MPRSCLLGGVTKFRSWSIVRVRSTSFPSPFCSIVHHSVSNNLHHNTVCRSLLTQSCLKHVFSVDLQRIHSFSNDLHSFTIRFIRSKLQGVVRSSGVGCKRFPVLLVPTRSVVDESLFYIKSNALPIYVYN